VPFAKRKPGRSPLQRMSDQRRSLALAGLAVGAVFSAAFFRRRRRGEEVSFEPPRPAPSTTPTEPIDVQPESGSPAAVEVPPPAASAPAPMSATPEAATISPASEPAGSAARSSTIIEPATGELSAEEASILAVLAQHGRVDDDRTAIAVATSLERETGDVTTVLRKLSAEGVVSGDLYTAAGDKIWAVTERGVRRLGAQH
jgi:hypothetical protein